jgi:hypothetical protein
MTPSDLAYSLAIQDLKNKILELAYEYEKHPLKSRGEAIRTMLVLIDRIEDDVGKRGEWREHCLALAAFALFCGVSDSDG